MKPPKKRGYVRRETHATWGACCMQGPKPYRTHRWHRILGTLTYCCHLGLHNRHRQFFLKQKNQVTSLYKIGLNVLPVSRTKQRLKRRKRVYIAKPDKKTLTLNKVGWFRKVTFSASHWYRYSTKNSFVVLALSISIIFFFGEFLFLWGLKGPLSC